MVMFIKRKSGGFYSLFYQICSNKKKASWLQALHCCFLFCYIINIHMYIVSEEYWNVLYRDHVIFLTKNYHENKVIRYIVNENILPCSYILRIFNFIWLRRLHQFSKPLRCCLCSIKWII